ncbi:TonB-dependent receptor plug domain-containing protein [Sphingobacterium wenxiniae]|uniref:Iron complex outermembrane recepter protein n=1 Tax=Sphingobacterium wenxiniae TaxID=683125 RepID=A0A1I6Q6Y1_9SPHI|nr:TonB-dependent receptor [Sphingobacterium wenxiniae]SFS48207.1 iron complex outermembrane recepter protein [Sphingobacterium wenxiniae]
MKLKNSRQILLATVLLPLSGIGQDMRKDSIPEVMVHANRLQIPFSKDNRNVEILTAEDIRRLPIKTLNEALTFLNGVDIRQRGPFGSQADMSIDGGSFEQTLLLVNGVKVADPQTAHHNLNLPIPLEAIERIEVLRGAAARIYGMNALTGAINIITKTAKQSSIHAHLYGGSSFKDREEEEKDGIYYHAGAQIGATLFQEKHQHQFYYNKEQSNGQRYNTASENDKLHYQGQWDINSDNKIEWLGSYMHNRFGANGFYAAPGDKESEEIVETVFASISSTHQLSDKLSITPRLSNRYNEDDYRYFKHDLSRARSLHYNNALSMELNSRYQTGFGDFGLGWESRLERINSSNLGDHERNNHGAYAEFRTESIRRLTLNAGAYLNYNSQYGWQLYPGVDMGYALHPNWKVVFNAGSSQRIPSFTDLYINQRPGNIGNPDLRPEEAWQLEGAIKFQRQNLTAHAGYFHRTIDNFIDYVRDNADEPYQPFNLGQNLVNGINTNINYHFTENHTTYHINLGYNYLDPSIKTPEGVDSKYNLRSLKHQAKLLLSASQDTWRISVANRWNQRMSRKAYFLTDIRLSYAFSDINIYADVQNIFDVTYIESAAIPMPGRWFSMGVRYNWLKK